MTEKFIPRSGMELLERDGRYVAEIDGQLIPAELSDEISLPGDGIIIDQDEQGEILLKKALFVALF